MKKSLISLILLSIFNLSPVAYGYQWTPLESREHLLFTQYVQTCGVMYEVGMAANSLLSLGQSVPDVTDTLIQQYGYGEKGDMLEGSAKARDTISSIVASVDLERKQPGAYPPEDTPSKKEFFLNCKKDAWTMAQRNAQLN